MINELSKPLEEGMQKLLLIKEGKERGEEGFSGAIS